MKSITKWRAYCTSLGMSWWLATSHDIIGYLELFRQSCPGCKQSTVYQHLSAISFFFRLQNRENPCTSSVVSMYMRGLKRYDLLCQPGTRQAKPITKELLSRMNAYLTANPPTLRIWRTVWRVNLSFYALLRWDDVCRLKVSLNAIFLLLLSLKNPFL